MSQTQVPTAKSDKWFTLEDACMKTGTYIITRSFQLDRTRVQVSETLRQTHHTDKPNYLNPRCACAPRVNEKLTRACSRRRSGHVASRALASYPGSRNACYTRAHAQREGVAAHTHALVHGWCVQRMRYRYYQLLENSEHTG